jgi:hypothetical protein
MPAIQGETELAIKPIRCSLELFFGDRSVPQAWPALAPLPSISKEEAAGLGLPAKLMAQHNFRTCRRAVGSFKR